MAEPPVREVATPHGPARVHVHAAPGASAALVLGHGAGGSVTAPDLTSVTRAVTAAGATVVLVEQPYRVAGKRSTPRPPVLDAAWEAVLADLLGAELSGLAHVAGGRSSGARVACRTARATGAAAVLALAFPLRPPQRRGSTAVPASRQDELDGAGVPVLVVQGVRDRFGMPEPGPGREVLQVPGDHGLKTGTTAIGEAVAAWLPRVLGR